MISLHKLPSSSLYQRSPLPSLGREKANELDAYHFSKDGKIPTETLDKIIENFEDAKAFDSNYRLVAEKDGGKIKMQEIDRSRSQERDDR